MSRFVPVHLEWGHIMRDAIRTKHTRPFANEIFGIGVDRIILIAHGTHIFIEKRGNYQFQRRIYSMHSIMKTWKILENVVSNLRIPFIGDYLRIFCAL